MDKEILEEPLYAKINSDLRKRADTYVYESKMLGQDKTDTLRKLIETALDAYMINNPVFAK